MRSNRLHHVAGASALLVTKGPEWVASLANSVESGSAGLPRYEAGGTAVACFCTEAGAKKFVRRAIREYAQIGIGAKGACVECDGDHPLSGKVMPGLYRKLRDQKDGLQSAQPLVSAPPFVTCQVTGRQPVVREIDAPGGGTQFVSRVGELIAGEYARARREWFGGIRTELRGKGEQWGDFEWAFPIEGLLAGSELQKEHTLEQAEPKSMRRLLAIVCADGNRMGERIGGFRGTLGEYACDTNTIRNAVQTAVVEAAHETLGQEMERRRKDPGKQAVAPFLPLLMGGDDVIVAVQAIYALEFVKKLCEVFQDKTKGALGQDGGISFGVGMTIGHVGFPLSQAFHIAHNLQKSAKKAARDLHKRSGDDLSAVDYALYVDSYAENIETAREEITFQSGTLRQTAKPYLIGTPATALPGGYWTLEQFLNATQGVAEDKDSANRFWRSLPDVFRRHPEVAAVRLKEALRQGDNGYREVVKGLGLDEHQPFAERDGTTPKVSPIPDLVEWLPFERARSGKGERSDD
jgi:hypothetical protein